MEKYKTHSEEKCEAYIKQLESGYDNEFDEQEAKEQRQIEAEKDMEIYHQSNAIINSIKKKVDYGFSQMTNHMTLRQTNAFYDMCIEKYKRDAFNELNSRYQPHIVYRVNKYFSIK